MLYEEPSPAAGTTTYSSDNDDDDDDRKREGILCSPIKCCSLVLMAAVLIVIILAVTGSLNRDTTADSTPTSPSSSIFQTLLDIKNDTPTKNPTRAPTPKPTNPPMPNFAETEVALNEKIDAAAVVLGPAVLSLTSPPTVSPTPYPTEKGYVVVVQEKEMPALATYAQLAITVAQGNMDLMKRMVEQGVAASVGLRSESVRVTDVVAAARRLGSDGRELEVCGESQIGLEIESASGGAELKQLMANVQQAFTEGGAVTYVKAAAAELGILTQCLKDQKKELPKPAVQETVIVRKVVVQKRATAAPTDAPTDAPTTTTKARCDDRCKTVLAICAAIAAAFLVLVPFVACRGRFTKKEKQQNQQAPTVPGPVSFGEAEESLTSSTEDRKSEMGN